MPNRPTTRRIGHALGALAQRQWNFTERQRRAIAIVLSIVVAFLLWFTFKLREQYLVVIEMPIEVVRLPEDRALSALPPQVARVALQGIGVELLRLGRNPPVLMIDAAAGPTIDMFVAASESPRLPPGVTVQSVSPPVIHLQLDPRISRRVPVRLEQRVAPARDYDFLGPPRFSPDSVTVSGSRAVVSPLESFPTAPLVLENVRETIVTRVPLSDTLRGLVRTDVMAVEVTVPVGPFTEGRREIPVRVEGAPPGGREVALLPSTVQAVFRVPLDQYQRAMRAQDFYAFVPYEIVAADATGSVQPIVHLPAELTIRDVRLEPRRVRYWFRVE